MECAACSDHKEESWGDRTAIRCAFAAKEENPLRIRSGLQKLGPEDTVGRITHIIPKDRNPLAMDTAAPAWCRRYNDGL